MVTTYVRRATRPILKDVVFTATKEASEKLKYWIDMSDGEFGGMGVCANPDDLKSITDFCLIPQKAGWGHNDFDDGAMADYFVRMAKKGLQPKQFARIWFHTHPGNSSYPPSPSGDDDNTFVKAFGQCDWAAMLILNKGYASILEIQGGKGTIQYWEAVFKFWEKPLPKKQQGWKDEFDLCVRDEPRKGAGQNLIQLGNLATVPTVSGFTGRITHAAKKVLGHAYPATPLYPNLTKGEQEYLAALDAETAMEQEQMRIMQERLYDGE